MRGCFACFILPRVLCVNLVKLTAKRSIFLTEVSLKECCLIPTAEILYSSDEPKSAAVYNAGWKTRPSVIVHTDLRFLVDGGVRDHCVTPPHCKESHVLLHGSISHQPPLRLLGLLV